MKLIFVLFRRSDLSHDESLDQWSGEQHTSIVRTIPGLKWSQNYAITLPGDAAADGIGELWFDSPAAMEQAMNSPHGSRSERRREISPYGENQRPGSG
jgi:uncharacterized protein (TIGR02118 family)